MGDWAHRFGASPLMRMTASWSWSAWTDRIQVRGAMLRPWAGSPQIVVADPTRCALSWRSDRTRWRQETGGKVVDRKSPIQVRGSGPNHWQRARSAVAQLVLPIPSHRPLRHTCPSTSHASTASRPRAAYAADGRSSITSALGHQRPAIRAILLARATVTSIGGLRASMRASQEPAGHALAPRPAHHAHWPQ